MSNEKDKGTRKCNKKPQGKLAITIWKTRITRNNRKIKFNELAKNLDIKLIRGPEKSRLNITEYISNDKNLKIRPIFLSLKDKCKANCSEYPLE